ncbi:flagellar type III secretion system protein FlhB [Ruegeria sp. 2205SS24-7]|uniref:flagellar type III secretion system protein FlhB n=1 Tax=Ruegeria discodermiae TaxID=3064389 RepID=UPI0027418B42|nr:flagellar type III secretion system protein FlhB [Ruegeria sp. 2205SS24-7]MDP5220020.1 flagellar type III secretion system protein FlhB [Ruegeria sp. 2205SS24-7]
MSGPEDGEDKSFEPTPRKLQKAREKGELARSADLNIAAVYGGFILTLFVFGASMVDQAGTAMSVLLGQSDQLSQMIFDGPAQAPVGGVLSTVTVAILPLFLVPAAAVILSVVAQQAFVVAPAKIKPKLSKISLISNAKNKYGRSGLFEFAKSFLKLVTYGLCLALFLKADLNAILTSGAAGARPAVVVMMATVLQFLMIVFVIALAIGSIDFLWQRAEHLRKNRMTRKEFTDEMKESDGDPHMKNSRRQRGQEIAMNQMIQDVPDADVVIVNPTHFAVALKWSRLPGSAPICVAKGVDEIAAVIRETAISSGVPIHSDPPAARSLHASVEIGQEIDAAHYQAVAAAIRFAEKMRKKARGRVH